MVTASLKSYQTGDWLVFIRKSDDDLLKHCRVDEFKATGKGGQKRNKVTNAIRLTLAHLMVTDSSSRSRATNQQRALRKMRLRIALDTKNIDQRSRFKTFPREALPYLQGDLIRINTTNPAFPFFVGGVVDLFATTSGDWKKSAETCEFSVSQLKKFTQKHSSLASALKRIENIQQIKKELG